MSSELHKQTQRIYLAALNLLVPGTGLVLTGSLAEGLGLGVAFLLAANIAVWATLLTPDDFSAAGRAASLLTATICYLAAQVRLVDALRRQQVRAAELRRRNALAQAQHYLARGDYASACSALEALADLKSHDLLVAYRLAQALSGLSEATAGHDGSGTTCPGRADLRRQALEAWEQVRRLDRDGIYRDQVREALKALDSRPPPPPSTTQGPQAA